MTGLEWALAGACSLLVWLLVRSYRKQMILRHLFIQFTDWTAAKIDRIVIAAEAQAIKADHREAQMEGRKPDDEGALGFVGWEIVSAKADWGREVDDLQSRLRRNGMRPLDLDDKDIPLLSPGISGIKH